MKKLLFLIFSLLLMFIFLGAGRKASVEDLYGTWVNSEYEELRSNRHPSVLEMSENGIFTDYVQLKNTRWIFTGYFDIDEYWQNRDGTIGYRIAVRYPGTEPMYTLRRLSRDGSVLELNWSTESYPDRIDTEDEGYRIYYRQKDDVQE
jgi:hypothetical protein